MQCVHGSSSYPRRTAMTLVELLVVVMVAILLLASSIPMMRPAIRDAQIREAARQLNVLCTMAKSRARELGRPAGIWIERSAAGGNAAIDIHLAEEPPPYMGDFMDARADIWDDNSDGVADRIMIAKAESASLYVAADPTRSLAQVGDLIQFDHKGPRYPISAVTDPSASGPEYRVYISISAGVPVPRPTRTPTANRPGVPYTVFRQPVRSSLKSLQLGGGVAIDLDHSGIGVDTNGGHPGASFFSARYTNVSGNDNDQPVVIMFEPGGSVSRVYTRYYNGIVAPGNLTYGGQRATGTIYLLIGRFEQTSAAPVASTDTPPVENNLQDLAAIWVAIAARTGAVTTAENASAANVDADSNGVVTAAELLNVTPSAREIARSSQAMGGQ